MKRKIICLATGLALLFVTGNLFGANTNLTPRLISADLQQTNGPLDTMFNFASALVVPTRACVPTGNGN